MTTFFYNFQDFVDVLVALDKIVDNLWTEVPESNVDDDKLLAASTEEIGSNDHNQTSLALEIPASLETFQTSSLELTRSFEKLISEVKELNKSADEIRRSKDCYSLRDLSIKPSNDHLYMRSWSMPQPLACSSFVEPPETVCILDYF